MKGNNLYSGLVTPSSGWWSPIDFWPNDVVSNVHVNAAYVFKVELLELEVKHDMTW
jgi:hypothetical protein